MINWKVILGALLIFAGFKESINVLNDSIRLDKNISVPALLGCITLMLAGIWIFFKGRNKKVN